MEEPVLSSVDVWVIVAAALVLLMTPGVAFLYGGMTRAKSALNMIMMSIISMGIVGVVWVLWGYSVSGASSIGGVFGNPFEYFALQPLVGTPDLISAGFGATFAIITVALISGSLADRARFSAWIVFVPIWVTLVYCPLAFMVWGDGGVFTDGGAISNLVGGAAIDYAGGTVVHINAGVAALVLALIVGRRTGFRAEPLHRPHNVPLVVIGAALLWFGWFGFNAGAASDPAEAGLIWVNTLAAPAAAMLAWLVVEKIHAGKFTAVGGASGIVAGLVAITPSCANLDPWAAILLGLVAGAASSAAIGLKYKLGYDDSMDVVGVHLVAGLIGTIYLGFFAFDGVGLFYGGGATQLLIQVVAALVSVLFTAVMTCIIGFAIHKTIGFRVTAEEEDRGVDLSLHDELAYEFIEERIDEKLAESSHKE
ncbi:ammonium transporter [Naumannella halotolerans]|uniref:Ammonium transporter n=1 Tax=Naumannella halotolerans TaxID=993414 RepID=A0A4R7J696_9ACTN|nr:ammonium transporter [Naumannella halotolerans]TDT32901.1 Amt family ammonium transporter [Naumannella halotolerans]